MSKSITITIPIPPALCSPNARGHYHAKAKAKATAREDAATCVMIACHPIEDIKSWGFPWRSARLRIKWYHPTTRHRDRDNITASLKASIDGLVDAGLLVDDDQLTTYPPERLTDKKDPRVELTLERDA